MSDFFKLNSFFAVCVFPLGPSWRKPVGENLAITRKSGDCAISQHQRRSSKCSVSYAGSF